MMPFSVRMECVIPLSTTMASAGSMSAGVFLLPTASSWANKNDETTGVESRSKHINAIHISLYFRHTRPIIAHATNIVKGDNKTGNSLWI
jgi:hypothetical protein